MSGTDRMSGAAFSRFGRKEVEHLKETKTTRFTDAEMDTARDTDLPDLLEHLGYRVRRVGKYYTTSEMDSLRIKNRRTWFRYSERAGGDAITFLQKFCGMTFPEAVNYLLDYRGATRSLSPAPPGSGGHSGRARDSPAAPEEKIAFALPPPNADQRRVFAYLRKRGISARVINSFINAGLLYEDAEHHNCVFVGRDGNGTPVFANKRGTCDRNGSGFKGDVPGSNKAVAFRLPCDPALDTVYVFEAPIDLMSCCTLRRDFTANAVALCCLDDGALATYLTEHPHLKNIALCLDADRWGQEAAKEMRDKYEKQGYTVAVHLPPGGKDWNEYLQQRLRSRERER